MSRPKDKTIIALSEALNITRDYARKIIKGTKPITVEMRLKMTSGSNGHLNRLVTTYGLLTEPTPTMVFRELQIAGADLTSLIGLADLCGNLSSANPH